MLITQKGILMRTRVSEIRETGRNAQGVRLIKVDDGDKLVAMAKVDAEETPKGGEGEVPAGGPAPEGAATDDTSAPPQAESDGSAEGEPTE
jgi:DNA gyrase subunit A